VTRPAGRRLPLALLALAVAADVGLLGAAGVVFGRESAPKALAADRTVAGAAAPGLQDPSSPRPVRRSTAVPQRIVIPSIGVDAPIERLARDRAGVLQPPVEWADAGWYAKGVVPGDTGAAVIAGHLDTTKRAAVFVNLRRLRPGDKVVLRMSDHRSLRFTVTETKVVRKALFPTSEVYGAVPDPELRLITCSEPFDVTSSKYTGNLVVFAARA
jgi:LPXTG-site transpeptidase (sortase) family protein